MNEYKADYETEFGMPEITYGTKVKIDGLRGMVIAFNEDDTLARIDFGSFSEDHPICDLERIY